MIPASLTYQETASTIEALYDALKLRMLWTSRSNMKWRQLPWSSVQEIINSMASAHAALIMKSREMEAPYHPLFYHSFTLPDIVVDYLNEITIADDWLPPHDNHGVSSCELCSALKLH
jgi:hypothetical protein